MNMKTVNFDDTETYHLYFGDSGANPGTNTNKIISVSKYETYMT